MANYRSRTPWIFKFWNHFTKSGNFGCAEQEHAKLVFIGIRR